MFDRALNTPLYVVCISALNQKLIHRNSEFVNTRQGMTALLILSQIRV